LVDRDWDGNRGTIYISHLRSRGTGSTLDVVPFAMPTADVNPLELDLDRLYANYLRTMNCPALTAKSGIRKQILLHRMESADDQPLMVAAFTRA